MRKIAFILLLIACFGLSEWSYAQSLDYPNASILVTVDELEKNLDDKNMYVIDVRKEGYTSGHIPGAIQFDMDLLVDNSHPIDGYLVQKESFEKVMRNYGLKNDHTVVIYDQGGDTNATRLFYALEYFGHEDVKIVNGGFAAWEATNKKISTSKYNINRGDFKVIEKHDLMMTKEEVKAVIGKEEVVLLDVRSPEEYKGRDVRAKRGGHIPSAINVEWKSVLNEVGVPEFRPLDEIVALLEEVGASKDKKIVVYCQKANRASHMYFTLRLLGYENLSVYEGSWEEWGNDPNMPIVNPSQSKSEFGR
ncbi:sulfurtransferase [Alkalihalobacillus deserti]|uniref:sulfurtransferase n=1 Tax=Alkalihalobacillus deserti TaxID=2879466 RepID=UPI001D15C9C8|nr:sulfurtransferase [Alkalihalobacillus deserti]